MTSPEAREITDEQLWDRIRETPREELIWRNPNETETTQQPEQGYPGYQEDLALLQRLQEKKKPTKRNRNAIINEIKKDND